MISFTPTLGLKGSFECTVSPEHLADAFGNADVAVLATPMLLDLMEVAAHQALQPIMPHNWVSLGISADFKHLRLTPSGLKVRAEATIIAIDRQKIDFHVEVYDEIELVGKGYHSRFCMPKTQLDEKIQSKMKSVTQRAHRD